MKSGPAEPDGYRFEGFFLDPKERVLKREGASVELPGRYLDALTLLVRERGKLVSKQRFLDDVWQGVPVTDEALTQCIKTLRKQLGDEAARPRFIETVPKHGYRFLASVSPELGEGSAGREDLKATATFSWRHVFVLGSAGTLGGAVAGMIGGLFYGFAGASQPLQQAMGAVSVLMVLVCLTGFVASIGAAGVSFAIAATQARSGGDVWWSILGGAFGGLIVGAAVKLILIDAFNLLFGQSPGNVTGAAEGAALGAAVGVGAWLERTGAGFRSIRRRIVTAALTGASVGMLIPALGGRLMGGSLALLAEQIPQTRLRLDPVGHLLGEVTFGPISQVVSGGLEGALFAGFVIGAMILARHRLETPYRQPK